MALGYGLPICNDTRIRDRKCVSFAEVQGHTQRHHSHHYSKQHILRGAGLCAGTLFWRGFWEPKMSTSWLASEHSSGAGKENLPLWVRDIRPETLALCSCLADHDPYDWHQRSGGCRYSNIPLTLQHHAKAMPI